MRPGPFVWCAAISIVILSVVLPDVSGQAQPAAPRQASPRGNSVKLAPIEPTTDEQKRILGSFANGGETLNAFTVCLNNPDLCRNWTPFTGADDRTVLEVADALYTDRMIPDASWSALAKRYSAAQMMDAVFTVGQYSMISMLVRSGGVQQESGKSGFVLPAGQ